MSPLAVLAKGFRVYFLTNNLCKYTFHPVECRPTHLTRLSIAFYLDRCGQPSMPSSHRQNPKVMIDPY